MRKAIRKFFLRPTWNEVACAIRTRKPHVLLTSFRPLKRLLVSSTGSVSLSYTDVDMLKILGFHVKEVRDIKDYMDEFMEETLLYHPKSPYHYPMLYALVKLIKAETVVETGVGVGYSTYAFLKALGSKGRLYSIDVKADVGQAVPDFLKRNWNLCIGDSVIVLPRLLKSLRKIDAFFHDSVHTCVHQLLEYSLAWKYLRKGGLLLSDDVNTGAISIFSRFVGSRALIFGNRLGILMK